MKIFQCQACDQPVSFESAECGSCQRRLGYVARVHEVSALEPLGGPAADAEEAARGSSIHARPVPTEPAEPQVWRAYADPAARYRFCANAAHGACNWLVRDEAPERYCVACRHNHIVPDLASTWNLTRWRQIEAAKHRLFYSLLRLDLPMTTREDNPSGGLAFDFLVDPAESFRIGPPVLTGHRSGLITLNIAEADDVERERRRMLFGEHYRTLLGHFRHEIGHYFWDVLVRWDQSLFDFRARFGDERRDYGQALQRHYAGGGPADWEDSYVSAYAASHPWEDFAETFAHYLHIVDTLETASAFEIQVRPRLRNAPDAAVVIDFDSHRMPDLGRMIAAWLPLTYAVNSLSRSMGQADLYPFQLTPTVIAKLAFVHERIYAARNWAAADPDSGVLKAVATSLRQRVAAPNV